MSKYSFRTQIDLLINWYKTSLIDLGLIHFDQPDSMGHGYGPNSEEYLKMTKEMDDVLCHLFKRLEEINMLDKLNLIVVSDHGMTEAKSRPMLVTNYVNTDLIDFNKSTIDVVSNIYPKNNSKLSELYTSLAKIPHAKVYLKHQIPESYHYRNSIRTGIEKMIH
jgi:predicted AlkP superfamily pyrophosphatase or phosphodiesterase